MEISNPVVNVRYYKETYSDQDISRLCKIAGLSPDDVARFHEELEHFAAICRWETSKWATLPRSSDVARDLRRLTKRISRLDDGLENLPDEAAHELRVAIDKNNSFDFARSITGKLSGGEPSLAISLPDDALPITGLHLRISEFRQLLAGLERATEDAISNLPKRRDGQLRDYGLRIWMINIKALWERTTQAPFTRGITDSGDPVTPAACFCVAAFHFISPDYPKTRILWEMRHRIRKS